MVALQPLLDVMQFADSRMSAVKIQVRAFLIDDRLASDVSGAAVPAGTGTR